jgi:aspartate/methionine/tyrosine aminotransferase
MSQLILLFARKSSMPAINRLVRDTGTPPIPEAVAWLSAYRGTHGPVLNLSQAVPGYPTHPDMLARLAQAAGSCEAASYGPIMGDEALRASYAAHVSDLYRTVIAPSRIAITAGCNQAFVSTVMTLFAAGDSVIIPTPWYFNHAMTVQMLGVEAIPLPCRAENALVPEATDAERLIRPDTRAILLVTPNNPTGAVYPPETIAAFSDLCRRRGLWLILDETYRDFIATNIAPHHAFGDDGRDSHIVSLYSFSKSYCIPGHRVGVIIGHEAFMDGLAKVLDCVQICAPRAAQMALVWAIPALADWRGANRAIIAERARVFRASMTACPGWRVLSLGAYFAYVAHPFADESASDVARRLAQQAGVLTLPGPYFGPGQDGCLRIAFANADATALESLPRRLG